MADLRTRIAVKLLNNASDTSLLSDATALADNMANPTTSLIGAMQMVFDGTNWDRAPGTSAGGSFIQGPAANDAAAAGNPLLTGGRASAAAPTDVSADGDAVQAWYLRNGAQATVLTAAGALIGGDATNGLDVDVTRLIPGTAATNLGKAIDSAGGATDTGVAFLAIRDDALTTLTPVDGDYVPLRTDDVGALWVNTELPAAAALADNTANPTVPGVGAFLMGWDGTNWDRLSVANSGRLQVDVITGGGSDTPTTPTTDIASSSGTAAGATANLDTTDLGGNTRLLNQVDVTSSVPWKATVGAYENGALVKQYTTLFGRAGEVISWKPPHRAFASRAFAANAGFDGFRVVATNLDNSQAADLYASFHYSA